MTIHQRLMRVFGDAAGSRIAKYGHPSAFFRVVERRVQPGACIGPVTLGHRARDAQQIGGFLQGETGKIAQLDQFCFFAVLAGQLRDCFVQGQDVILEAPSEGTHDRGRSRRSVPAVLGPPLAAGIVDQDAPHGFGRGGKEMPAAVPVLAFFAAHKPQIDLVHRAPSPGASDPGTPAPFFWAANLRSASYTSGSNCSGACGSALLDGRQNLRDFVHTGCSDEFGTCPTMTILGGRSDSASGILVDTCDADNFAKWSGPRPRP